MSKTKYTYAVARIRALEVSLLTNAVIEQLLACKSAEQALQLLVEKGWGDLTAGTLDADEVLNKEEEKMWQTIREVAPDMHVFDVLSLPKLYHNLKAAIKEVCTEVENKNIFYDDCEISGEEMFALVQNKEFDKLPGNMPATAREAFDTLLHTRDGQLCDLIIDRATLEAMLEAGKKSGEKIIEEYAQTAVAIADIKIAVRSQKTGKNAEFMKKAMVNCSEINVDQLTQAALAGAEEIAQYLEGTSYREGADALRISPSAFERWCDNKMTDSMRSQKYESFSVGPLLAYLLARQNEIKTVRIILTGKQNEFPDEAIRERIREMYVIAVMGDYDSIYGFATLGLSICPVKDRDEAKTKLRQLAEGNYGIIYITEAVAAQIPSEINKYGEQTFPAIIQIPGVSGNTGAGVEGVKKTVEQAVGSDILFGGVSE